MTRPFLHFVLGFVPCSVLCFASPLHAQDSQWSAAFPSRNPSAEITSTLLVRHLHLGGWDSHVIQLAVTADSLLLSGAQQYANPSGRVDGFCIFPAQIPLEHIVAAEAKPDRFLNGLKLFSATSNSHVILLHLEYRDDRGGAHSYDFIPADAQQSNNEWSGGAQDAVRTFAATLKYTAAMRVQQLNTHAPAKPHVETRPLVNPVTGDQIPTPDQDDDASDTNSPTPSADPGPVIPAFCKALMCSQDSCSKVTVWPVTPDHASRLRVVDNETSKALVDVPLQSISAVKVRRRTIELQTPTPGQVTINIPVPFTPPLAPKVYQLCFRVDLPARKPVSQCFISDLASCALNVPCEEGADQGRHVLDLQKQIESAIGVTPKPGKAVAQP